MEEVETVCHSVMASVYGLLSTLQLVRGMLDDWTERATDGQRITFTIPPTHFSVTHSLTLYLWSTQLNLRSHSMTYHTCLLFFPKEGFF